MLLDFTTRQRQRTAHMYRQACAHATGRELRELIALMGCVQAGHVSHPDAQGMLRDVIVGHERRAA